jgi:short-subunit dehydrogenase
MLLKVAASVVDFWLARGAKPPPETISARAAVSELRPAIVVTGGSRGIGLAIAGEFALREHAVVLVARGRDDLANARAAISSSAGASPLTIVCDVADATAFEVINEGLKSAGLYLDVLVNNAGTGLSGPFASHSAANLQTLLALNIDAVTRLTRLALPDMLARRRGGVLNVASLGAYAPGPHQAAYYASKSYVLSLTEAIAVENAGRGVRFAVLAPGPIRTTFHSDMGADQSLYLSLLPVLSPQRVAHAAYVGFILGQRVIVPGLVNRALVAVLKVLPHPLSVPLIGWLLRRR